MRRETLEIQKVDSLSKKVTFALKQQITKKLKKQFQCEVLSVNHNDIANVLSTIMVRRLKCLLCREIMVVLGSRVCYALVSC